MGHAMTAGHLSQLRASDQDRDRATSLLGAAYAEGRLTKDEFDVRLGQVADAQVFAQLDAVTADLIPPAPRPPAGSGGTNSMAIASVLCGAAQLIAGPLPTIPAIAFGHVARRQIRRTGEEGAGLALWGLVLGYAGLALMVVSAVAFAAFVAFIATHVHGPVEHVRPQLRGTGVG